MSTVDLPGRKLLQRTDGRLWKDALTPTLRDTVGVDARTELTWLTRLDGLIEDLLVAWERWPLPKLIVHVGPARSLDCVSFASALVGHRAERLTQAIELSGASLAALEAGSVQVAAVTARALLEVAFTTSHVHEALLDEWRRVHGDRRLVLSIAEDVETPLWRALWTARVGTRSGLEDEGWPSAINVQTRLRHASRRDEDFLETLTELYGVLCEATHPNVEAQGVLWRRAGADRAGRVRVQFAPLNTESPVKACILDALGLALALIVPFCVDLWWVAAEVVNVFEMRADVVTAELGLPQLTGRNDPCCCGSGRKTKRCDHPEPTPMAPEGTG